ncbi:hypothetical protein BDR03DRAFT_949950 [Suillus americanus]|nr:hypothetical protein BDR03DRAFT_949950 [Suillus americanus]
MVVKVGVETAIYEVRNRSERFKTDGEPSQTTQTENHTSVRSGSMVSQWTGLSRTRPLVRFEPRFWTGPRQH